MWPPLAPTLIYIRIYTHFTHPNSLNHLPTKLLQTIARPFLYLSEFRFSTRPRTWCCMSPAGSCCTHYTPTRNSTCWSNENTLCTYPFAGRMMPSFSLSMRKGLHLVPDALRSFLAYHNPHTFLRNHSSLLWASPDTFCGSAFVT